MKNLLKIGVFALYALCMMLDVSCIESTGPSVNYKTVTQSLNANATKKGESFTKTYTIKLDTLFRNQVGLSNLLPLSEVFVTEFTVEFNDANCAKLESYLVEADFPKLGKFKNSDCTKATDFGEVTAFGKTVKETNLAYAIKSGESITVTFTMKAKEDIPAGVGITIKAEMHIRFFE